MGDAWYRASDFRKASEAYTATRKRIAGDRLRESQLMLKHSWLEEKLGKCRVSLRWAARALKSIGGMATPEAARHEAQLTGWYATVVQAEGRSNEAIRWAREAIAKAEAADDVDALAGVNERLGSEERER